MRRTFATAAGLLASLVLAAPAAAFTPPELFVRAQKWDTHEETGPWIPLAQAPALNFLGGYEIGYRLQESPAQYERQHVALQVTGVPDGAPTQPGNATPFCVTRAGTVGEITPVAPELQFEGLGNYSVKVSIGEETGDDDDCLSGPSSSGTFSVDVRVAPTLVGGPLYLRRDRALPGDPFVGVRAASPPGGAADIQCMLGSTPLYTDPAETHPEVPEFVFPRPGNWSCAARGVADGRDGLETVTFGTPFSAPISFDVRSVFRYRDLKIAKAGTKRPRLRFLAEFPAEARGGLARVKLRRVTRCTNRGYRTRRAGTYRARFGPKRAEVRIRRPRPGFYFARFAFGGTHFLKALSKTEPLKVKVTKKRVKYVGTLEFTPC